MKEVLVMKALIVIIVMGGGAVLLLLFGAQAIFSFIWTLPPAAAFLALVLIPIVIYISMSTKDEGTGISNLDATSESSVKSKIDEAKSTAAVAIVSGSIGRAKRIHKHYKDGLNTVETAYSDAKDTDGRASLINRFVNFLWK